MKVPDMKMKVPPVKVKVPSKKVKVKVPAEKHKKHAKAEPFFPALLKAILIARLESPIKDLMRPVHNSQTGN